MQQNFLTKPSLSHAEPVLAVADVLKTVKFYHEVLAFPEHWTYGEPVNHGGVSWNGTAFLQFSLNPDWAAHPHRESVWIRAKNLQALYELHSRSNVDVVIPMVNRPWGFSEYTIRDLNGYYITFAEPSNEKKQSAFPPNVKIRTGVPDSAQLLALCELVGWQPSTNHAIETQRLNALLGVLAEDTETQEVIGCAFLLGDDKTIYYIKDVIVHPKWQGSGIGTAMMEKIMDWLQVNGSESATVGLFTGEHLAPFYKQFGFTQACGMYTQVRRKVHG
jgi:predicted GNAT family N-acyltransferase